MPRKRRLKPRPRWRGRGRLHASSPPAPTQPQWFPESSAPASRPLPTNPLPEMASPPTCRFTQPPKDEPGAGSSSPARPAALPGSSHGPCRWLRRQPGFPRKSLPWVLLLRGWARPVVFRAWSPAQQPPQPQQHLRTSERANSRVPPQTLTQSETGAGAQQSVERSFRVILTHLTLEHPPLREMENSGKHGPPALLPGAWQSSGNR